ncbi:hypothetical protein D0864_01249 [Hortaea werneckii]|uniref:Uncharacterized protein n=1 Tax=Hortaea werneckii TaxID=91943 RepID=A0A3M7HBI6_HORWE|nr:hypothetical protein D0864_01249 [Hortaea werneckii]
MTRDPTVLRAVDKVKKQLTDADFIERNGSPLIACTAGDEFEPRNVAASIAGYVDVLIAKLKSIWQVPNKIGYAQLGVVPDARAANTT